MKYDDKLRIEFWEVISFTSLRYKSKVSFFCKYYEYRTIPKQSLLSGPVIDLEKNNL
jgi:hypothetical protein